MKSIENTYQKKTQLEHILLRPDTYIGAIEAERKQMWVYDEQSKSIVEREINFVPGLYKIFDEVLVNASDNFQRDRRMSYINVKIDQSSGIPVQIHTTYGVYVPEMIFGQLLTSSNYDDSEKKVTGGRNGYGAKLANAFSVHFEVEAADHKKKKLFRMAWKDNMSAVAMPATVTDYTGDHDYTMIKFKPDLKRFKMKTLSTDMISLFKKRIYDMAGILDKKVTISLNGKKVKVQSFLEYVNLYQLNKDDPVATKKGKDDSDDEAGGKAKSTDYAKVHEWINKRWEVVVTCSEGQFVQASFVNGICTSRGGTHVEAIIDQITQKLAEHVKKKHKDLSVKPFQIKNNLAVFINCLIENPAFDSQTKETLTTPPDRFGSEYAVSEKFIKDVLKCGAVDFIVSQAMAKERVKIQKVLSGKKTDKVLGVPKLEDANWAGTKQSSECLLILTEGDSAKALAMAGLDIVGRDRFGVFPLRGKLLNVREVSNTVLKENVEIQAIVKILGLRFDMQYTETSTLRYGGLLIMADQDHDGSHIKGLIINFIHYFWPSLIKLNKFMKEFVTPVMKVTKQGGESLSFFTIKDFKAWQAQQPDEGSRPSYKIKYYKGLGTSTNDEARQYFKDITKHVITFKYAGRSDDDLIELAFAKSKADDRKKWIENSRPEDNVDHSVKYLTYTDFINKELVQYSIASNLRAIPCLVDGFKPGQRKIMFGCFKRNLKQEVKVAQLTGYVAEHSAYHHGEASLSMTIVNMAQDFIGSNNISLLEPLGQFGSRSMGGKDSASPRYIFTKLCPLTRTIFSELDDPIMDRQEDDGMVVEPTYYAPVIPLVLANGASGIGMGWSTYVPPHNPLDLVENLRRMLDGQPPFEMDPWFYGFRGTVTPENAARTSYAVTGIYKLGSDDTVEVTELPAGLWTNDYKDFLEELMTGQKGHTHIGKVRELHKRGTVHFSITFKPGVWEDEYSSNPEKKLKLINSISLKNMVLFGQDGKIFKFDRATDILIEFFHFRLEYYKKRKDYLLKKLSAELRVLQNKVRFVRDILDGTLVVNNVKKDVLEAELTKRGFDKWSTLRAILEDTPEGDSPADDDSSANEFDYLLGLKIWQLTYEKAQALQDSFEKKELEKVQLERKTPEDLWRVDLNAFEEAYKLYVEKRNIDNFGKEFAQKNPRAFKEPCPVKDRRIVRSTFPEAHQNGRQAVTLVAAENGQDSTSIPSIVKKVEDFIEHFEKTELREDGEAIEPVVAVTKPESTQKGSNPPKQHLSTPDEVAKPPQARESSVKKPKVVKTAKKVQDSSDEELDHDASSSSDRPKPRKKSVQEVKKAKTGSKVQQVAKKSRTSSSKPKKAAKKQAKTEKPKPKKQADKPRRKKDESSQDEEDDEESGSASGSEDEFEFSDQESEYGSEDSAPKRRVKPRARKGSSDVEDSDLELIKENLKKGAASKPVKRATGVESRPSAKKAAPKRRTIVSSSQESDSEEDESDFEDTPKRKAGPKRVAPNSSGKKNNSSSEKPKGSPAPKPRRKIVADDSDEDY